MRNLEKTLLAVAISAVPGIVSAQEFQGVGTLGYGHSSISNGGGDVSSYTLEAAGSVSFDSGLHVGLDGRLARVDPDQITNDVDASDFGLKLNYQFKNGAVVGGYVDHANLDVSGTALDVDVTSYGLSGGYVTDSFGAELFIGESETSPSLPGGVDWQDYGLKLRYVASERFRVGGHVIQSELSQGGADIDLTSWGVGGSYGFSNGWSGFAGVNWFDVDNVNLDATTFGVGVGYDLKQVSQVPALVSLELARSDVSLGGTSADVDTIRLGVTFPLGNANGTPPLNSVAHSAMSPRHNSVSTLVNTAF
jgi:hypothetical protein